jgi:hypothetical protein
LVCDTSERGTEGRRRNLSEIDGDDTPSAEHAELNEADCQLDPSIKRLITHKPPAVRGEKVPGSSQRGIQTAVQKSIIMDASRRPAYWER